MTKFIDTYTCNTNVAFIGIFMGKPLGYIVCYHHEIHDHDQYVMKNEEAISGKPTMQFVYYKHVSRWGLLS